MADDCVERTEASSVSHRNRKRALQASVPMLTVFRGPSTFIVKSRGMHSCVSLFVSLCLSYVMDGDEC